MPAVSFFSLKFRQTLFFVSSLALFAASSARAGITQGKVDLKIESKEISLIPQKGFHMNEKAPAEAFFDANAVVKPKIKEQEKFVFDRPEKKEAVFLKYYVCDDANTVCEKHEQKVTLRDKKSSVPKITEANDQLVKKDSTAGSGVAHNPALSKYKNAKRATLLMFSAPWCPSCIRMATETYNQPAVKKALGNLNVEKINIDLVENENLAKALGVKAIPTVVLLDKAVNEVYRWLDYQPAKTFADELIAAKSSMMSLDKLEKKAVAGDASAAEKMGEIYNNKMQWQKAIQFLSLAKSEKSKISKAAAEVAFAEENKDSAADDKSAEAKKDYYATLEKSFTISPSKLDRLRWKVDFLEAKKEDKADLANAFGEALLKELAALKDNKNIQDVFKKSSVGDLGGYERCEVLDLLARTQQALDLTEDRQKTLNEMAEEVARQKPSVEYPGKMIQAIYYLSQAEKLEDAEKYIQQLVNKYPTTYVYHQRYANFLLKQKRPADALTQIDLALKHKEGNEPQLNLVKVRTLKELGKKAEANDLIDSIMKDTDAFAEKYKRTRASLEKIKNELAVEKTVEKK